MAMDFTVKQYTQLLKSLQDAGFFFQTFAEYASAVALAKADNTRIPNKFIILRHDVDAKPQNSLRFAQIQSELGIKGTYYFRVVPQSYNERIIEEIAGLGHEVGNDG